MAVALFDTNILIDFLKGYQPAIDELEYWNDGVISALTWMELMAGVKTPADEEIVRELLQNLRIIHTDDEITALAAEIRRNSLVVPPKVPLHDAIIMATGLIDADVIVTRNIRDFSHPVATGLVRIPYRLVAANPATFSDIVPPGPPPKRSPFRRKMA